MFLRMRLQPYGDSERNAVALPISALR